MTGVRSCTSQSTTPRHRPSAPVLGYWALGQWSAQMPNTVKSPAEIVRRKSMEGPRGCMGSRVLPRGTRPPVTRERRGLSSDFLQK